MAGHIANSNSQANTKKTFCKELYTFLLKNPEACTINVCQKRTAYFKPTLNLKYVGSRISFTHQKLRCTQIPIKWQMWVQYQVTDNAS